MTWATIPIADSCGACGQRLEAGAPVAYYTRAKLVRCEACAAKDGHTPDDTPSPQPTQPSGWTALQALAGQVFEDDGEVEL